MPRILLFNGLSNYDWVRSFTEDMRYAFQKLGCECQMIDAAKQPSGAACETFIHNFKPHLMFGFNAVGMTIRRESGDYLPTALYPYFNFMVDDPMFHQHWLPFMMSPHVYTGLCDPTHVRAARVIGIPAERTTQVRLGGHVSPLAREEERSIDIAFVGAIADPETILQAWRTHMPKGVLKVSEIVSEIWGSNLQRDIHEVFEYVIAELGIELNDLDRLELQSLVVGNVNRYVRNRERLRVLTSLKGLPLSVFGEGWSKLPLEDSNFRIGPELSFNQAHEEICRSKILLNAQPIAVHAPGERALGALLNGALLATTSNNYLSSHFVDGHEFIAFGLSDDSLSELREKLLELLAKPALRQEMAERGRASALKAHTWQHRAQDILQLVTA